MTVHRSHAFIRFFTTDVPRKLLAILLACLFYWTFSMKNGEERRIDGVAIQVELPSGKQLVSPAPTVSLQVSFNKNIRSSVNASELQGKIRISERLCPDEHNEVPYNLSKQDFTAPIGVSISKVEPSALNLFVDALSSKELPVEANYVEGELPPDYRIKKITFVPEKVTVSGAASLVNSLSRVKTKPIPVNSDTNYTFDYRADLIVPPHFTVTPDFVMATVEVEKSRGQRSFIGIPVSFLNAGEKSRLELPEHSTLEVKIAGPLGSLGSLSKDRIHAFCDVSSLKEPGIYTVSVGCFIDRGSDLEIVSITPDKVKVKLSR